MPGKKKSGLVVRLERVVQVWLALSERELYSRPACAGLDRIDKILNELRDACSD